jgi:glucose dehydrogenase
MVRRTCNGWGYSPLDQVTPANVTRLHLAWVLATRVVNWPPGTADHQQ